MDGQLLQSVVLAAILAGAVLYLGRRAFVALGFGKGKSGCGGGCGCSSGRD